MVGSKRKGPQGSPMVVRWCVRLGGGSDVDNLLVHNGVESSHSAGRDLTPIIGCGVNISVGPLSDVRLNDIERDGAAGAVREGAGEEPVVIMAPERRRLRDDGAKWLGLCVPVHFYHDLALAELQKPLRFTLAVTRGVRLAHISPSRADAESDIRIEPFLVARHSRFSEQLPGKTVVKLLF
jgi:hypothetical protein